MFLTRLFSGALLVAAAILLFVVGDIWLLLAMGLLSLLACYELLKVFSLHKHPLGMVTYLATVVYYSLLYFVRYGYWIIGIVVLPILLLLLAIYVIRYPKDRIEDVTKALFAFLYVSVLLSFVYQTRYLNYGQWMVWLIVISSWGSDTCAYCVGKIMGKHHFSELSPKKTVEGCVGGILGAALIAFLYSLFLPDIADARAVFSRINPRVLFPLLAAVCALVSQIGDLAASAIKRNYKIKDYGKVIPGHGGVLDRFDSMIFVAPMVFYLLFLLG